MSDRPLSEDWEAQAEAWTSWARMPDHDSHFEYDWLAESRVRPAFLDIRCVR